MAGQSLLAVHLVPHLPLQGGIGFSKLDGSPPKPDRVISLGQHHNNSFFVPAGRVFNLRSRHRRFSELKNAESSSHASSQGGAPTANVDREIGEIHESAASGSAPEKLKRGFHQSRFAATKRLRDVQQAELAVQIR
jgi:hypothetical protein